MWKAIESHDYRLCALYRTATRKSGEPDLDMKRALIGGDMEASQKSADEKFCQECGAVIKAKAEICPKCGVRQPAVVGAISGIPGQRRCTSCGFTGQMKTWMRNHTMPQLVALILILFWVLPGVIFIAWAWGKYKCPHCGKVGEHIPA
ncbi:hypothetical protein [Uliginosibacterium gangwonense]|uniref:hypothetical protein n=1 Tax=Uliginosibacterium gangwonense TaxID=392736 RepID=UPI0012FA475E|nr:hypothetical protein [Uliginosibacterium gangwonense]